MRGLLDREKVGAHVAEDAEAGFGRVVGPAARLDAVEPLGEYLRAILGLSASHVGFPEPGQESRLRVGLVAQASERDERAESEILGGREEGLAGLELERLASGGREDGAVLEGDVRLWTHARIIRVTGGAIDIDGMSRSHVARGIPALTQQAR
jgi:hypothetical protein